MENRKFIILLSAGFFVFYYSIASAYYEDTHSLLTKKALEIYNAPQAQKIEANLIPYIIDGARREDDTPRHFNHFYDPIKQRGLTYDKAIDPWMPVGSWSPSPLWAQDSSLQKKLLYNPTIATILSFAEEGFIKDVLKTSDFTWNQALKQWIQGRKEEALFSLGHVVHLLQDLSVPDHTRNDPHVGDSPYEEFTKQFTLNNPKVAEAKSVQVIPTLQQGFETVALYSNKNFYSKDTIGIQSGYDSPQPDEIETVNGTLVRKWNDGEGNNFNIINQQKIERFSYALEQNGKLSLLDKNNAVLSDYWNLLSKKGIEYSAGLMQLFFKEVEKNKNNPDFLKEKQSFLSQVISSANTLLSKIKDVFSPPSQYTTKTVVPITSTYQSPQQTIDLSQQKATETKKQQAQQIQPTPIQKPQQIENIPKQSIKPSPTPSKTPTPSKKPTPTPTPTKTPVKNTQCSPNGKSPTHTIIFNELAWMGTFQSTSDEWIELKNISQNPISITGWSIVNKNESIDIHFTNTKKKALSQNDLFILERTDDKTLPNITADIIYTGALSNTNEALYLFDQDCALIDSVFASPSWPAGNSTSKKTMERSSSLTWYTSSILDGTPKKENSPQTSSSSGGSSSYTPQASQQPSSQNTTSTPATHVGDILFSEIMYNPEGSDTHHEWIELYNQSDKTINISEWKLRENQTNHHTTPSQGGESIAPHSYIIITENTPQFISDNPTYTGTIFDSSFSLGNDNETLTLLENDTAVATVTYTSNQGGNGNGNSLQYNGTLWCEGIPTIGKENVCGTQRDVLQNTGTSTETIFGETAQYNRNSLSITISWNDTDQLSENQYYVLYDISNEDVVQTIATTTQKTATYSIHEIGRTYTFQIKKMANSTESSGKKLSIGIPSFLSRVHFWENNGSPVIDITFEEYPFIPDSKTNYVGENGKKLVIFNKNSYAQEPNIIETYPQGEGVVPVQFQMCKGSVVATQSSLILRDTDDFCDEALAFEKISNNTIRVLPQTAFNEGDYVTLTFYSLFHSSVPSGGGNSYWYIAQDKTHYTIHTTENNIAPTSPNITTVLTGTYEDGTGYFTPQWEESTDIDGDKNNITYEVSYYTTDPVENWDTIENQNTEIQVTESGVYTIKMRAKDEDGEYSNPTSTQVEISLPPPPPSPETLAGSTDPVRASTDTTFGFKTKETFTGGYYRIAETFDTQNNTNLTELKITCNQGPDPTDGLTKKILLYTATHTEETLTLEGNPLWQGLLECTQRYTTNPTIYSITISNTLLQAGSYALVLESQGGSDDNNRELINSHVYLYDTDPRANLWYQYYNQPWTPAHPSLDLVFELKGLKSIPQ